MAILSYMTNGIFWCITAFVTCTLFGSRSTGLGLGAVMMFGYIYGIMRANFLDGYSHFAFDCGLIGFYLAQFSKSVSVESQNRSYTAKNWLTFLIGWPLLLYIAPVNHYLVQLVALRHIIFFLPVLLLATRIRTTELNKLAYWLGILNIGAFVMAVIQYIIGIEPFFPRSQVTEIMFRSHDVTTSEGQFFRIPATFTSAHAFGGTMLMTLPLFLNMMSDRSRSANTRLFAVIVSILTILSIFIAGPRLPVAMMFGFAIMLLILPGLKSSTKSSLAIGLVIIGLVCAYYVASDARMQRFMTLKDTEMVERRAAGSLHFSLIECFWTYPIGVGLGGVFGSSMPYFLKDLAPDQIGAENEYLRIAAEQGVIGFLIWITLIGRLVLRRPKPLTKNWTVGTHAMRAMIIVTWGTAFLGVGLLQSIPSTVLLLLQMGILLRDNPSKRHEQSADVEKLKVLSARQPERLLEPVKTPQLTSFPSTASGQ